MRKAYNQATYSHIQTKGHKVQIVWVYTTSTGLFPILIELNWKKLSQLIETCMLLMDYPFIRGWEWPYCAKNATWNLLHEYIDENSKILTNECPGYGLQKISRLKSQCENMNFSEQIRYNRLFKQVVNKGGESAINYIKRFNNAKALEISVGNSYSKD